MNNFFILLLTFWIVNVAAKTIVTPRSGGFDVHFELSELDYTQMSMQGEDYRTYSFPDAGYRVAPGEPHLPVAWCLIPLPHENTTYSISMVSDKSIEQKNIALMPSPTAVWNVAENDYSEEFLFGDIYQQNECFPKTLWEHTVITIRGSTFVRLQINVLAINALTQVMRVHHDVDLHVNLGMSLLKSAAYASTKNTWLTESGTFFKVPVVKDNIYRITWESLHRSDAAAVTENPLFFRVFNRGNEVPITITGASDSVFDTTDYIEFHGSLDYDGDILSTFFTDTNIYWLHLGGDSLGLRQKERSVAPGRGDTIKNAMYTDRFEADNTIYTQRYLSFSPQYYWQKIAYPPVTHTIPFDIAGYIEKADSVSFIIALQGMTSVDAYIPDHHVSIAINGTSVHELFFDGRIALACTIAVDPKLVHEGKNLLTLHLPGDTDAQEVDALFLDWFQLTWPRHLTAHNGVLVIAPENTSEVQYYAVDGFLDSSVILYRSDMHEVLTDYTMIQNNGSFMVAFTDSLAADTGSYLLVAESKIDTLMPTKSYSGFIARKIDQADYIIITHPLFSQEADRLAQYRTQHDGYSVRVISVYDIYDEFSYGIFNPYAIRDFIDYAYHNWDAPAAKFVCLLGDACWDYRKISSADVHANFIPSIGDPASDNIFVCVDGDDVLPDLHIGRLPAETISEAALMIDKIIAYENDTTGALWKSKYLFINGGENSMERNLFKNQSSSILTMLRTNGLAMRSSVINKELDGCQWNEKRDLIAHAIDNGSVWVNFFGHGGSWTWDCMYSYNDLPFLTNDSMLPFVNSFTCHTGRFANPQIHCFAEQFVKGSDAGAIGCFATTGWGYITGDYVLGKAFMDAATATRGIRVGEAASKAKYQLYAQYGDSYKELIENYVLIGDPALSLNIPFDPDWSIDTLWQEDDVFFADRPAIIHVRVNNSGRLSGDTLEAELVWHRDIGDTIIRSLTVYDSILQVVRFEWSAPIIGIWDFSIQIDPDDKIKEYDDQNNHTIFSVQIYDTPVVLVQPYDRASITGGSVAFTVCNRIFSSDTVQYFLELDTALTFETAVEYVAPPTSNNFYTWELGPFFGKMHYFWRVRSKSGLASTPWSAVHSFTTGSAGQYWGGNNIDPDSLSNIATMNGKVQLLEIESDTLDWAHHAQGASVIDYSSLLNISDTRDILGGRFSAVNPGAIFFNDLDSNQQLIVDLGQIRYIKSLKSMHTGWRDNREVWSYFSIESSVDGDTYKLWGEEGPFSIFGYNIPPEVTYEKPIACNARYIRLNYGIHSHDYGAAGSKIAELFAWSPVYASEGDCYSVPLGPATQWDSVAWSGSFDVSNSVSVMVQGLHTITGDWDDLVEVSFIDQYTILSNINTDMYPYIRLHTVLKATQKTLTPTLDTWKVNFKPAGEIVVNKFLLSSDSCSLGDTIVATMIADNIGYSDFDSCYVVWQCLNSDSIVTLDTLWYSFKVNRPETLTWASIPNTVGKFTISVSINTIKGLPEKYLSNNEALAHINVYDFSTVHIGEQQGNIAEYLCTLVNPVQSSVQLDIGLNSAQLVTIILYSYDGLFITSKKYNGESGTHRYSLNLPSHLIGTTGIYLCRVILPTDEYYRKIIIQGK